MMTNFALIHSPLVSPFCWEACAAALRQRGQGVWVPDLVDVPGGGPYWQQHVEAVVMGLHEALGPLVLVAHSGAGALLPAIGQRLRQGVAGYVLVDAVMPGIGGNRLDGFGTPEEMAEFRAYLEAGGLFPTWTADDLAAILPDAAARARLAAELRPKGLDYWTEPIPAVPGWPAKPGRYLRFTETYRPDSDRARALGWPVVELAGGHFEMMVRVEEVVEVLMRETEPKAPCG
jgi:pimeloyl-ACP methyl ester carboxylesterase